jgi:hypothetical protein
VAVFCTHRIHHKNSQLLFFSQKNDLNLIVCAYLCLVCVEVRICLFDDCVIPVKPLNSVNCTDSINGRLLKHHLQKMIQNITDDEISKAPYI